MTKKGRQNFWEMKWTWRNSWSTTEKND